MPAAYVDALKAHAREASALADDHAEEFLKLLEGVQNELRERLLDAGDPNKSLNAFVLLRTERETQAVIETLTAKAMRRYRDAAQDAVDMSLEHMGDELDKLSRAFDGAPLDVTLDAAKALADPVQKLLANHYQSSVERYGNDLLNTVRQRLFVAQRIGDPLGPLAREVGGERGPLGRVGRENAERMVRTETSNAYGSAQHSGIVQASKQVKGLKKVWLHVGSFRCATCMPLHGTERPVDGSWTIKSGRRSIKRAHAPAHPNCVCRTVAMKGSWKAGLEKLGYLTQDPDDFSSKPSDL